MEQVEFLWGNKEPLSTLQMSIRAVVVFLIALIILRISGRRSFGVGTPLDNIVVILMGAILSRTITGASPFLPVIGASLVIAFLHRFFSWCKVHSPFFAKLAEGEKILLYKNSEFIIDNMSRAQVTHSDMQQSVREANHSENMEQVEEVWLERNGNITIINKP